jgi:hypothetical protein
MSFTTLDPSDFVISTDSVTAPAWSSNVPTLNTFFRQVPANSSTITQNAFYLNVFQAPVGSTSASVQFSIAYGHQRGSGSLPYNSLVPGVTPSLTTYNQYNTLIYGPAVSSSAQGFNFGGTSGSNAPSIFAINVDRNRYKEALFPGTFNLTLSGSGTANITLCDNSNDVTTVTYLDCGRVFDIVSGSNGRATSTTSVGQPANGYTISGSYGMYLPDIGVILLNAGALALSAASGGIGLTLDNNNYSITAVNNALYTSSINNNNLFTAISGGYNRTTSKGGFQLNSQENISSDYIFCRVKNSEYNYSSNPTFITGSGNLLWPTMVNSPQTFVTTVGLYNDNSQLLAVAKMSRPLVKDFTKEALIRVKLDW